MKISKKLTWYNTTMNQELIRSMLASNPSFVMLCMEELIKETQKVIKHTYETDTLVQDGIGLNKNDFKICISIFDFYQDKKRISDKQYLVIQNKCLKYTSQIEGFLIRRDWLQGSGK